MTVVVIVRAVVGIVRAVRACSAFGWGGCLYELPQTWAGNDRKKRVSIDAAGTARQIDEQVGLLGK